MQRESKLQIFSSLLLFFVLVLSSYSQSQTINFAWEDKQKNESNGALALNWLQNQTLDHWELHLTVAWYDSGGEPISDKLSKPFIYLSDYDYEIQSDMSVECLNFSVSENIREIQFQDNGELRFKIPSEVENPGKLKLIFRYALSEEDIRNANIDPIKIPDGQEIVLLFPDTRTPEEEIIDDKTLVSNDSVLTELSPELKESCRIIRSQLVSLMNFRETSNRQLTVDDTEIGVIRNGIDNMAIGDTTQQNQFEQSLQSHLDDAHLQIAEIDSSLLQVSDLKEFLEANDVPSDSASLFIGQVNTLESEISTLRVVYTQIRGQIITLLGNIGSSYADLQIEAMKNFLEDKYSNVFRIHVDSVLSIQSQYSEIEPDLIQEIDKGPRKAYNNDALNELKKSHIHLTALLDSTKEQHSESYLAYRYEIDETGQQISSIETLHIRFDDIHGKIHGRMNNMNQQISRLEASMNEQIIRPAPKGVIIGGGIGLFLLLVILTLVLSSRRARKNRRAVISSGSASNSEEFSLIDNQLEESVEYYKLKIPDDQQDIVLSEVHFHLRVIKSVYHLIQGALLDKKPENFGGLMFGRQYKVNGNGQEKNIVIVERVIPAAKIRLDMSAGQEEGALLVDEIEEIVAKNKKQALLGWFTSAPDADIEMPDNVIKVHRTYFREKWQIACQIYPGSDTMNSTLFIRRKSGFFDKRPSKDFQLNWDELYQFAIDPPDKKVLEEKKRPDSKDYLKIELNQNWSDSIVDRLFIHPDILLEISTEKKNRIQMVTGQKANGFLYGEVWDITDGEADVAQVSYEIFINKFTLATSSENPRELPGSELLGWVRFEDDEIFEILKSAIPYHEEVFKSPYQISVLLNSNTSEIRFFSRKQSLEMNNNTIETEEFNLESLLDLSKSLK